MTPVYQCVEGYRVVLSLDRHGAVAAHEGDNELLGLRPEPGEKLPALVRRVEAQVARELAHRRLEHQERQAKRVRFRWLSPADFARRFPDQHERISRWERWHLFVRVPRWDGFCPWGERQHRMDVPQRLRVGGYLRVAVWEGWDGADVMVRAWDADDAYLRCVVSSRYEARELVNRMISRAPLGMDALEELGFRHD